MSDPIGCTYMVDNRIAELEKQLAKAQSTNMTLSTMLAEARETLEILKHCWCCGSELLFSEDRGLHCDGCDPVDLKAQLAEARGELKNVLEYLQNAPNATFERANIEAFAKSILEKLT